jgi:hypothetical protein
MNVSDLELAPAQQPTRTGKTRPPRRFDKTQLRAEHHGKYVHRDYAAHFFRWGWVSRHVKAGARVLDVGCGQDLPLMWVFNGLRSNLPSYYLGVDLNKLPEITSPKWAKVIGGFSFVDRYEELGETEKFDVITNFEVIEHVTGPDQKTLLKGFYHWLKDGSFLYLSTPVFNGMAAINHVKELTVQELQDLVVEAGFEVVKRYGTFASANDIRKVASPRDLAVYEELHDFYGGDVLSTFLAPLYPDASRNNLWVLRKRT